jgi:hypothetical protein
MPVEMAIWRLTGGAQRLLPAQLPNESQLEDLIAHDVSVLGLDVVLIGRQVVTAYGKKIDLVAIDRNGTLQVIELKRDRTPREVVAQALDYGSWIRGLTYEQVATICVDYHGGKHLEEVFFEAFGTTIPEAINQEHQLVIVASELDPSTERIVGYLSDLGVPVNVLFFRHFADEGRSYLARTWLIPPTEAEASSTAAAASKKEPWNGTDFYVAFGEDEQRSWEDAVRFGFVSGGGGRWYSRTLEQLQPGNRVFVCIPQSGYVGVGDVISSSVPVQDFRVEVDEHEVPILEAPELHATSMGKDANDPEKSEYVVGVKWLKTVPSDQAIWEKGMFANQNTACALRSSFTRDRVLQRLGLDQ